MKILLTGASGFVGRAVGKRLEQEFDVVRVVRSEPSGRYRSDSGVFALVGGIRSDTNWRDALVGVDVVVHCAAAVSGVEQDVAKLASLYDQVNVQGTRALAEQAKVAGVKRFIYISSIKVNGEVTSVDMPFTSSHKEAPQDLYGRSKLKGEWALKEVCADSTMEYVIVRPPIVYGPGVKGNFRSLMKWLCAGVPLPLGSARSNLRSMVYLGNLVDLIYCCVKNSAASNKVLLVSDGEDISTRALLNYLSSALGVPCRLVPVPHWLVLCIVRLFGISGVEQRLFGSLRVDISNTMKTLQWKPPYSLQEGLQITADFYKSEQ